MTTITKILGDRLLIRRNQPEPPGEIFAVPGQGTREQPFFATVVAVGWPISEPIKPGDTILCAAPRSQDRVGTRTVLWQGEPAEIMSTLDVMGIVTEGKGVSAQWKQRLLYQEIHGNNCSITLEPRPDYCDRGNFLAKLYPTGSLARDIDDWDSWPRYYFDEARAKLEIEAWLKKRGESGDE